MRRGVITPKPAYAPSAPIEHDDRSRRTRRSSAARIAKIVALSIAVLVPLGAVAGYLVLRSEGGRSWLAGRIEASFDEHAGGSLEVGAVTSLSGLTLTIEDMRFLDPRGREFLRLPESTMSIVPSALLIGELRFEDMTTRGLVSHVFPGRGHTTTLEEGLDAPEGTVADFDSGTIRIVNGLAVVDLEGSPEVRLSHLSGFARVTREGDGPAHIRLDRVSGRFATPSIPFAPTYPFRGRVQVTAEHQPVIDFVGRLCRGENGVPIEARIGRRGIALRMDAEDDPLFEVFLAAGDAFNGGLTTEEGRVDVHDVAQCPRE